jgi:hypothetical protein
MVNKSPIYGITTNNIPFVRFGSGPKTLLVWSGGPAIIFLRVLD